MRLMTATRYTTSAGNLDPLTALGELVIRQPAVIAGGAVFAACWALRVSVPVAGWTGGIVTVAALVATVAYHRLGWVPRMRRAMVEMGVVYRRDDGRLDVPKRRGRVRHIGRNAKITWKLPPGVTLTDVLNVKEALEARCQCELVCAMDGGLLHMEILGHRVPQHVAFSTFYRGPRPAGRLLVGLGMGRRGALWCDLSVLPHMLIGGLSGTGKSVYIRASVTALALRYGPERLQLALLDLKGGVELAWFGEVLPHVRWPVAGTIEEAAEVLSAVRVELDRRLELLRHAEATDLDEYAEKTGGVLPRIVVVVDEMGELTLGPASEVGARMAISKTCARQLSEVGRLGRAAGIHLLAATQRPDSFAAPGQLKANMPGTVAFRVRARVNSEILLDAGGAERLPHHPGRAYWQEDRTEEFQAIYLSQDEARRLIEARWSEGTDSLTACPQRPGLGGPKSLSDQQEGPDDGWS